jgi:hypothetical protein
MKYRNAVKLTGDVLAIEGTTVILETKDVTGQYADQHRVEIPDQKLVDVLKPKQRITLFGQLDRDPEPFSTRIVADVATVKKVAKSAPYENLALIVGRVPISAVPMLPIEGKQGFINLALEAGGKIFNGVAFFQLATMLGRVWRKNALAQLMGRLRTRKFPDRNGDERISVEIVANDQFETKILKAAESYDPFEGYGDTAAVASDESAPF